jgi:hypothetical protein
MRWPPARRWSPSTAGPSFSDKASLVVNALLLGSLLYRSCLVARTIPLLGLIGAPPRDLYRMIVSPLGQLDRHRSIRLPDSLHCLLSAV